MQKFLNTMVGSWVKVFLAAFLLQYLNFLSEGKDFFTWDLVMLGALLRAGFVAVIPLIINYLNPAYKLYGKLDDAIDPGDTVNPDLGVPNPKTPK